VTTCPIKSCGRVADAVADPYEAVTEQLVVGVDAAAVADPLVAVMAIAATGAVPAAVADAYDDRATLTETVGACPLATLAPAPGESSSEMTGVVDDAVDAPAGAVIPTV
jgi:hypothetical protein